MTVEQPTVTRDRMRHARRAPTPPAPNATSDALKTRRGRRRHRVIDLFAGPGGWDLAAQTLNLPTLGIEMNSQACATRRAAGLPTLQADVATLWGLIASPPCQAFSMAGKGAARTATEAYIEAIQGMAAGEPVDIATLDEACTDPRGHLVLEPLRWALATTPTWIALEQVPPVLPVWEAMADALRDLGYNVWTRCMTAEQYGVPQTRDRAILIARCDSYPAVEPPPTHQRYVAPRRRKGADSLFDSGRRVRKKDRHLLPWVSMADALGWPREWSLRVERGAAGPRWIVDTGNTQGGARPDGLSRSVDAPSPTIRPRADQLEWRVVHYDSRSQRDSRSGEPVRARKRTINEPAPTIAAASRSDAWLLRVGNQENATERAADEPAPTLLFGHRSNRVEWTFVRPATTIQGDPRVWPPGHKLNGDDIAASRGDEYTRRDGELAIRITLDEAAILQSFPPDYPWKGTKTETFRQVGNAIPPLLALHILRSVTCSCAARKLQHQSLRRENNTMGLATHRCFDCGIALGGTCQCDDEAMLREQQAEAEACEAEAAEAAYWDEQQRLADLDRDAWA